jgi:2-phosphoglycerate kinase
MDELRRVTGRIGAWARSVGAAACRNRDDLDASLRHADEQFHAAYEQLRNVHARSGPVLVLIGGCSCCGWTIVAVSLP